MQKDIMTSLLLESTAIQSTSNSRSGFDTATMPITMASRIGTETFKHEELPDASTYIRLVEIISVKKKRDIQVHCKLTTWAKATTPKYTAISYTWGDPHLVAVILVNGKRMEVRRNCEDVLRHPCRIRGGFFWIDAICINQADNHEKSFQVANMGEVFRDALGTLACVSRHEDGSEFLFKKLRRHKSFWKSLHVYGQPRPWPEAMRDSTITELYNALGMFMKRPYFQRVWIYQELCFGRDIQVCCEDMHAELSLLLKLYQASESWNMSSINLQGNIKWIDFAAMRNVRSLLEYGVTPMSRGSLRQMTIVTGGLQSEDLRDRVFGVLAMIDWDDAKPIQPDYGKDPFDLAVEVLQRIGHVDFDDRFLPEVIRVAQLLGLTANLSTRLADEIQERRSKPPEAPAVCLTKIIPDIDSILMSSIFWAKRIYFYNESWQIQPPPSEDADDQPASRSGSPETLLPSPSLQKWSKGHFWDMRNMGILLPQETQPQDWVLIPRIIARLGQSPHLAFIGRDINDRQIQIVGKALVFGWTRWPTKSTWTNEATKLEVYLDPRDAIVLAHSHNRKDMATGLLSKQNEAHMLQVDDYFETRLCGEGTHSYAMPMNL